MSEYIEMLWRCTNCSRKDILGREMNCPGCGHKKDGSEQYYMPDNVQRASAVTDPELLAMARAGKHWTCKYCGGHERDLHGQCQGCAGARVDPHASQSAQPERGEDYHPAHDDDTNEWQPWWHDFFNNPRKMMIAGSIAGGAVFFVWLMVFLFSFHAVDAKVVSIFWQHTTTLEERNTYHDSDWDDEMHSGAYNVSCERKFRRNENCHPYKCNPHDEEYDCRPHKCNCSRDCTSKENGFATCDMVCDTCYDTCSRTEYDTCYETCPVYDQYCSYDYDRWDEMNTAVAHGNTHEVWWPNLHAIGPRQRTTNTAIYRVSFVYEDEDDADISVDSLDKFQHYTPGETWIGEANRIGMFRPIAKM